MLIDINEKMKKIRLLFNKMDNMPSVLETCCETDNEIEKFQNIKQLKDILSLIYLFCHNFSIDNYKFIV